MSGKHTLAADDDVPAKAPSGRRRDPERTKAALLDAARAEFAAKGLAGARVNEIAARAGVNKQLISHYFGGKEGLHRALAEIWHDSERTIADPSLSLEEVIAGYLKACYADLDLARFRIRVALDEDPAATVYDPGAHEVAHLQARREDGEIAEELDPAFVLLLLQSIVMSGLIFPADTKRVLGLAPGSPEHLEYLLEQLRLLVRRLGASRPGDV